MKTGSTALQGWLLARRQDLANEGVWVPWEGLQPEAHNAPVATIGTSRAESVIDVGVRGQGSWGHSGLVANRQHGPHYFSARYQLDTDAALRLLTVD